MYARPWECTLPERTIRGWSSGFFPRRCWKDFSSALIWGTLHLGALQELIHQGHLLCEGGRQLYDLSRQVLFAIWIGRAWKKCIFLSSGSVVDFGFEIRIGECQVRR
ncbi:hypothetical protein ACFX15_034147 [Malus domestica]